MFRIQNENFLFIKLLNFVINFISMKRYCEVYYSVAKLNALLVL